MRQPSGVSQKHIRGRVPGSSWKCTQKFCPPKAPFPNFWSGEKSEIWPQFSTTLWFQNEATYLTAKTCTWSEDMYKIQNDINTDICAIFCERCVLLGRTPQKAKSWSVLMRESSPQYCDYTMSSIFWKSFSFRHSCSARAKRTLFSAKSARTLLSALHYVNAFQFFRFFIPVPIWALIGNLMIMLWNWILSNQIHQWCLKTFITA